MVFAVRGASGLHSDQRWASTEETCAPQSLWGCRYGSTALQSAQVPLAAWCLTATGALVAHHLFVIQRQPILSNGKRLSVSATTTINRLLATRRWFYHLSSTSCHEE